MSSTIECAFTAVCVKAPELKTSKSGKPFCTFSVAIGEADAKRFARVAAFSETAEKVAAQLATGGKVYCEGTIDFAIWAPEGRPPQVNVNVAARRVEILGQIGRNRPKREQQEHDER